MSYYEIETAVSAIDEEIATLEERIKELRIKRLEIYTQRAGFIVMEDRIIFNEDAIAKYTLSTPPSTYQTIHELVGKKCRFFYHNQAIGVSFNARVELSPDGHLFISSDEGASSIDLRSTGINIKDITLPPTRVIDKEVEAFVFVEDKTM